MDKVKCPWCGKLVSYSRKGNIEPHFQSARVRCVGVGQPRHQIEALKELQRERKERADGV